jgi:hypothetical protein
MRNRFGCVRVVSAFAAALMVVCGLFDRQARGITLPVAGVNLVGYSYYGTALPFVDVAHMSNKWISVSSGSPGGGTGSQEIQLNANGYPSSLAAGQIARTLVFTNNGQIYPLGQYVLQWQGNGNVRLGGSGFSATSSGTQQAIYNVTSTNGAGLYLDITSTDPANPVRNISLRAPFPEAGSSTMFNPGYQKNIAGYGVLRMMGWNATNNITSSTWASRTTPTTFHWGGYNGVPYEAQIQLSNELREDLWINVPHLADDDYVRKLAQLVQQQLSPGLRVWVEYSNEVWNGVYPQAAYAYDVLRPKYGVATAAEAYGRRSAEIFDIFSSQIADPTTRLVRVIAGQTANTGVLSQSLKGATVSGTLKADVAAVAPYFTIDTDQLYQRYRQGAVDLNTVFDELHMAVDSTMKMAADNQKIAAANNLPLVSYEGGQHLVPRIGPAQNDPGFVDLLSQINRDDRMGALYTYMLGEWAKLGGKTFTFSGDVYASGKWGSWGLQESYLDTNAAKYKAVQQWLKGAGTGLMDMNRDGATNVLDYYYWKSNFGSTTNLNADISGSGAVDAADFVMLLKSVSTPAHSLLASSIPEPGTVALAFTAVSVAFLDGRRQWSR